ncbi:alpha/beta fold hydrolase [Pseudomonas lini]|uniref:alpha/beta fold hydrolase n=1 Tax=Pseudomonas lini TaxID=163011 RepID=UPI00345EB3D2
MSQSIDRKSVVLIHGWGGSAQSVWNANGWFDLLRNSGFDPVGIDLPGHGDALRSHDPAQYADLASEVMAQLPNDQALLGIGYSLGCKILLEIEARQPGRFTALVLGGLGGNVFAPEALGTVVAQCLEEGIPEDSPPVAKMLARYGVSAGNDPLAIAACLRREPNPVLTPERLQAVECPVLLVSGDADTVAYPVDLLADSITHSSVEILTGIDHLHLPENKDFMAAALRFLAAS